MFSVCCVFTNWKVSFSVQMYVWKITLQSQFGVQRSALLPARRFWISDLLAVFVEVSCSSCFTVAVSGDVRNGL